MTCLGSSLWTGISMASVNIVIITVITINSIIIPTSLVVLGHSRPLAGRADNRVVTSPGVVNVSRLALRL